MDLRFSALVFALAVMGLGASGYAQQFACTQVIGYSQVGWSEGGWYMTDGVFEETVGSDGWQLIWGGGAGVDRWQDPNYDGWNNDPISPCARLSDAPDRVLLSVSAGYGEDLDAWVDNTDAAVQTIREKIPSARMIILQAVVGGPDHNSCNDGVRAARQHPVIDEAIAIVAGRYDDVVEGYSPEVESCGDFSDGKGHLTADAAATVGRKIGEYYLAFDQQLEPDTVAPTAPSDLTITDVSATSVTLSWTAATDDKRVASYSLYEGSELLGTTPSGDLTTHTFEGLTPSTDYTLTLTAGDGTNESVPSAAVTVRTQDPLFAPLPLRVNAAGPGTGDFVADQSWTPESGYGYTAAGNTVNASEPVSAAEHEQVYQSVRYADFSYRIMVPNDTYRIVFHFAEFWRDPNRPRHFMLDVNGEAVASEPIDVYACAGGQAAACTLGVEVTVTGQSLRIDARNTIGGQDNEPILCGFEILPRSMTAINATAIAVRTPALTVRDGRLIVPDSDKRDRLMIVDLGGRTLLTVPARTAVDLATFAAGVRIALLVRGGRTIDRLLLADPLRASR